jgi:hypothetical protein
MDPNRVLLVGNLPSNFESKPFLGDLNLSEFGLIIWEPQTFHLHLSGGHPPHQVHIQNAQTKLDAVQNWVASGNYLIVILNRFGSIATQSGSTFQLSNIPPLNCVRLHEKSGSRVEEFSPGIANEFFSTIASRYKYEYLIESPNIDPLLKVAQNKQTKSQVVGGAVTVGSGKIIFLPPFSPSNSIENMAYVNLLATLPEALATRPSQIPEWANLFMTPNEMRVSDEIIHLKQNISDIEQSIRTRQQEIDKGLDLKQLFAGTGKGFQDAVARAFSELGLNCIDGPPTRADLLGRFGNRLAAIETKGIDGPAREGFIRQVETWVSETKHALALEEGEPDIDPILLQYVEQLTQLGADLDKANVDCKGVVVIGTFRKKPLPERTEPDFPDAVIRVIAQSRVCALSGLQLFGLVAICREQPERKTALMELIFSTNGVLDFAKSWNEFLKQKD